MLYDNYQKKMNRLADNLAKLLRMLPLLIAAFLLVLASVVALLASKGAVSKFYCKEQITYGNSLDCSAKAFLSGVRYEYCAAGNGEWQEGLPEMPGTYSVRAVGKTVFGNDRYSEPETVTILPRRITVRTASTAEYGDIPALIADSLADGDRVFCENFNSVILPDSGDGDTIYRMDMTPAAASVSILDGNGNDVTAAYLIETQKTTVSLKKRNLSVKIPDVIKIYDGTPLTSEKYEYESGSLLAGDSAVFAFTASQTEAGEVQNKPNLKILNAQGEDITVFYNVTLTAGKLRVEKRPIFITTGSTSVYYNGANVDFLDFTCDPQHAPIAGHKLVPIDIENRTLINAGTYANTLSFSVLDGWGNNVSDNYALNITEGTIEILPIPLTVTTPDVTLRYDGKEKSVSTSYTVSGTLAAGHTYAKRVNAATVYLDAGIYPNSTVIEILDEYGREVTFNYYITYDYGTVTIEKMPIKVITESKQWVYDGMAHENFSYTLQGFDLPESDYFLSSDDMSNIQYVGSAENQFTVKIFNISNPTGSGEDSNFVDVTRNFEITYQYGTLTVTRRPLSVQTGNETWVYDGYGHTCTDYIRKGELDLAYGDQFIPGIVTELTEVGKASNIWREFEIADATGYIVTDQYDVSMTFGEIEVVRCPIQIRPAYEEKIYDGTPLFPKTWEVVEDTPNTVSDLHTVIAEYTGSRTDAGMSASQMHSVRIYDRDNRDVTENYIIQTSEGTLLVKPRPIQIKPAYEKKIYDGLPLVPQNWEYTSETPYELLEGHTLTAEYAGSRVDAGIGASSIVSARVMNGTVDVSHNYEVEVLEGELEVYPRPITIRPMDEEKIYDGIPLVASRWEYTDTTEYTLLEGHELVGKYDGSQLMPGTSDSLIETFRIMDGTKDVSDNYAVSTLKGLLTVKEHVVGAIKTDIPQKIYLKEESYNYFDGLYYTPANNYFIRLPGEYSMDYLTTLALANAGFGAHAAELKDMTVYLLPYYRGEGNYPAPQGDVRVGPLTVPSYELQYYSADISQYKYLQGKLPEDYQGYEWDYRYHVYSSYMYVEDATLAYMNKIIAEQNFDPSDPDVIMKVASYIQNSAKYNLDYNREMENEDNIVIAFLDKYQEGVCRHYAAAATLLYRALGIPARVTVGYALETKAGEFTDITKGGAAHAWVEVYIDGVGWMNVEVTAGMEGEQSFMETGITVSPEYQYKIYDKAPLIAENKITGNALLTALLERGYTYSVQISGSQTEIGRGESLIEAFTLYDPYGNDVTAEYNIQYLPGVLEVLPEDCKIIYVYLYQLQKYYDGKPLAFEAEDFEILEMPEGLKAELTLSISMTDAGQRTLSDLNENFSQYVIYKIYEEDTMKDVTSKCRIIFENPDAEGIYIPIRIRPRNLTLTAESEDKIYDGLPLVNGNAFISFGSLAEGHRMEYEVKGSITYPGTKVNQVVGVTIYDSAGNKVTKNYDITREDGVLEVFPEE